MSNKEKYRDYYIVNTGDGYDIVEFSGALVDGEFRSAEECRQEIDRYIDGEPQNDIQAAFGGITQTPQC